MKKIEYSAPEMEVVKLALTNPLLEVSQTGENPGMHYGEEPGEGSEIEP